MVTTLIVRDATLAINGAPEKRGEPREHLRTRIAEVSRMEPRTAEECMEVLGSVANGEQADSEVLEALIVVGLAHPAIAARMSIVPVSIGRRLAVRLERTGEIDRTLGVLELLLHHHPGQDQLERDMAAVMRRQGMVQNLVERYFERAERLIREGRHQEAIGWLREVVQLDRSRKDAMRMIRDLRFHAKSHDRQKRVRWRFVMATVVASLGLTYLVLREVRVSDEYRSLPAVAGDSLGALRRRLNDLESFHARYPLWHGAFGVLSERSELRVEVERLEEDLRLAEEAEQARVRERLEGADLARSRGLMKANDGDLAGALADFKLALELGGADWPARQEVEKDVAAMEAHLEEAP